MAPPPATVLFFIRCCPACGSLWRWRVWPSCPLWQPDSSGPDVDPGPAEQIMLTQLSWAGCSLALSLSLTSFFPLPCCATHHTRIRQQGKCKLERGAKKQPFLPLGISLTRHQQLLGSKGECVLNASHCTFYWWRSLCANPTITLNNIKFVLSARETSPGPAVGL